MRWAQAVKGGFLGGWEQLPGGFAGAAGALRVGDMVGQVIAQVAPLAHGFQVIELAALGARSVVAGSAPQVSGGQDYAGARAKRVALASLTVEPVPATLSDTFTPPARSDPHGFADRRPIGRVVLPPHGAQRHTPTATNAHTITAQTTTTKAAPVMASEHPGHFNNGGSTTAGQ